MAFFMDLYGHWGEMINQRNDIWILKRLKLKSVEYHLPEDIIPHLSPSSNVTSITVQEGWWFSAHEQWKYLELPYQDIEINRRVFINGERARSWNSAINRYPGLFASVTDVASKPDENPPYTSALGIPSIAFQPVEEFTTVTPYASFPLWLLDQGIAAVWYHLMLSGPSMQGPMGSTESCSTNGTMISPVLTWDSKISTIGAMLGGISDFTRVALQRDGHYDRFKYLVTREWTRVFHTLNGELLPLVIPSSSIPQTLGDFSTCTTS